MLRAARRIPCRDQSVDDGFTLIEAVVALVVAALIFSALALSVMSALRASMTGRQDQQATDFMTRQVERARTQSFASLAMSSADPQLNSAGDSRIANCSGSLCVDPGTGVKENLYVLPAGAWLGTHTETIKNAQSNSTSYVLRSYVTKVAGQDPAQTLRFTVFIDYKSGSSPRSKSLSTIISKVQRGLPLPIFKLTATTPTSVTVNPGARMTYGLQLVNQGAPDRWNITLTGSASTWSWSLYRDVDADGYYDPDVDELLTDTNGDGVLDSGRLDPNGSMNFLAVHDTTVSDGTTSGTLTVTATSVAQPTATGAAHSVTVMASTQMGAISGGTPTPTTPPATPAADCNTVTAPAVSAPVGYSATLFSLHNSSGPPGGATVAQAQLPMTRDSVTYGSSLSAYSTNLSSAAGRMLSPAGSLNAGQVMALTDTSKYVDWNFTTGSKGAVSVPALLQVWVGGPGGAAFTSGQLMAVVYQKKGSPTVLGFGTASVAGCVGFSKSYVSIAPGGVGSQSFNNNETYGVRLVNTGSTPIQVAYDTPVYAASLTLAVK